MPKRGRRSTLIFSNNNRVVRERTSERQHFLDKYNGPTKAPYATELVSIPEKPAEPPKPVKIEKVAIPKSDNKTYILPAFAPFGNDFTLNDQVVRNRIEMFKNDPAIQPTKTISNLQMKDETQQRKVPRGRYDTTYRREYLNFNNGLDGSLEKYAMSSNEPVAIQAQEKATLNPYPVLPPIPSPQNQFSAQSFRSQSQAPQNVQSAQSQQSAQQQQQQPQQQYQMTPSLDHILPDANNNASPSTNRGPTPMSSNNDNYLPRNPIYLNPQEEQALMIDTARELKNYSSDELKNLYSELTSYDPNLSGFTHYNYVTLVAMRNRLPISESLLRFLMSRYVSLNKDRGFVNYEELIKFLARCLNNPYVNPQLAQQQQQQQQQQAPKSQRDSFDPDEQAILRLMHENMREWDQVNLIDTDNLRRKLYEIDPYNRYILTQREIEDVLYRERIPIQRSLIYQILEKYCKVATGQYKWPAFVDFLEKVHTLRLPNKKKADYILAVDEKDITKSEYTYRSAYLDSLKSKVSEEERLEEINKQIYNLQNMKYETQQRIESRLDDVVRGESWFTRFMRLANAMYSHRVNNGLEFSMPKDEAKKLISAYNTVYELSIPYEVIEDGLARCINLKGFVVIDDLLKVLSKVK